ncbi:hypothetical protein [Hymenobacter guriensis]|uniref:Uncharacterized protein n=1 Tax=Hymenobacter guriensis TaxID=2793065 RepID=A0ABS0L4E6_9BACT|nr:hypothetical protein [Hymenobacter guriensis]MBG8555005.1 hypothetical protein [Hymenobacter guriensis]
MHIVEQHYLGLELKHPSRVSTLRELETFVSKPLLEALGDDDPAAKQVLIKGIWHSLVSPTIENLLFTESAQEVIRNIKVEEAFDLEILRVLPAKEILFFNFLLGKNRVIKCTWNNDFLIVIDITRHEYNTGIQCESAVAYLGGGNKNFTHALRGAIQCLIFYKLTEPELLHVAAGKKQGTRKQGHYNATPYPITIVDSTWNKYIVRTEGFSVSGHFRLQRYGTGNAKLKLVWIKPYQKHGYVRLPKAETI